MQPIVAAIAAADANALETAALCYNLEHTFECESFYFCRLESIPKSMFTFYSLIFIRSLSNEIQSEREKNSRKIVIN